ncbi:MAG: hypothetical protein EBV03_10425 [Proteobacteria bacterium]|nr:hypothetical protein [Pseudomonadota bacterium]
MAGREDAVKLYIIEKALATFGDGSVSRLVQDREGMELYCYLPPRMHNLEAMAYLQQTFPSDAFDDADVLSSVYVGYDRIHNAGPRDEQMHRVTFTGSLTEMADNAERIDRDGFAAAQKSQRAMQILRREKELERKGRDFTQ